MDTDRIAGMSTNDEQARRGVHRRMLDPQLSPNFLNSKLEWRRLFAELWGTFLLVMVAAGGGVVRAVSDGQLSLAMIVVAPGMMVMAIIYFMGAVSGAHLNPAVTLAFAVRRNFPWRRVPGYCLAQLAGGIAAAVFLRSLFGIGRPARGHGARPRHQQFHGHGDRSGADGRIGEYDPWHRILARAISAPMARWRWAPILRLPVCGPLRSAVPR